MQVGEWQEALEVGELVLVSVDTQFEAFEPFQLLYFPTRSHFKMGNRSRNASRIHIDH